VNVIFICPILMAMSFHLLVRSSLRAMGQLNKTVDRDDRLLG
jgi:hypothetical protein